MEAVEQGFLIQTREVAVSQILIDNVRVFDLRGERVHVVLNDGAERFRNHLNVEVATDDAVTPALNNAVVVLTNNSAHFSEVSDVIPVERGIVLIEAALHDPVIQRRVVPSVAVVRPAKVATVHHVAHERRCRWRG